MNYKIRRKAPIHRRLWHFATDYFYYRSRGYSRRASFEMASNTI